MEAGACLAFEQQLCGMQQGSGGEAGGQVQLDPGSLAGSLQRARDLPGLDPRLCVTEQALALQVKLHCLHILGPLNPCEPPEKQHPKHA